MFGWIDKWMHSHLFDWKSMGSKLYLPRFCMELIFCVLTLFCYGKGIGDYESRSTHFFLLESLDTRLKEKGRDVGVNKLREGTTKGHKAKCRTFPPLTFRNWRRKNLLLLTLLAPCISLTSVIDLTLLSLAWGSCRWQVLLSFWLSRRSKGWYLASLC